MNKSEPGRVVQTRLAALPSGVLVEGALDASRDAWLRQYSGDSWSPWAQVGAGAGDIEVAGASDGTVYVVLTPAAPSGANAAAVRRIHMMTPDGALTGTSL